MPKVLLVLQQARRAGRRGSACGRDRASRIAGRQVFVAQELQPMSSSSDVEGFFFRRALPPPRKKIRKASSTPGVLDVREKERRRSGFMGVGRRGTLDCSGKRKQRRPGNAIRQILFVVRSRSITIRAQAVRLEFSSASLVDEELMPIGVRRQERSLEIRYRPCRSRRSAAPGALSWVKASPVFRR